MEFYFKFICLLIIAGSIGINDSRSTGFEKTRGAVWPQPQRQSASDEFLLTARNVFDFKVTGHTCDILTSALNRYYKLIFEPPRQGVAKADPKRKSQLPKSSNFGGWLKSLNVDLSSPCGTWPTMEMDENYTLVVDTPDTCTLYSKSIWGVLRGLETFSQLVYKVPEGFFVINKTNIYDFPRFSHRGLMLDTSRHYVPKRILLQNLEAMAQNKYNVFHWHIVDDQSFPYESYTFPSLSHEGAFNPYTHTYSLDDVAEIIEFARVRGIRVIPEFDSPGHTQSWGYGIPGFLTQCFRNNSGKLEPNGYGPANPILDSTFDTLKQLFSEIVHVFPDKYVHLGGDEVSFACWESNQDVLKFMKKMGFKNDFSKLEEYYMQKLIDIIESYPSDNSYIIWQEVIDNNVTVKANTVVEVWKSPYQEEMAKVTSKGYRTLLSSCWYLNYVAYGPDWQTYYSCEPLAFNGTQAQKKLVIGGEACMWGEYVDGTNLISRLWPRASAPAERLWSKESTKSVSAAAPRLEEHRCRMLTRGINAEPVNGASFCDADFRVM